MVAVHQSLVEAGGLVRDDQAAGVVAQLQVPAKDVVRPSVGPAGVLG